MSTEANSTFLDIKEEIQSDNEDHSPQNLTIDLKNFKNTSNKSCVQVQVLSYKDIEGIKEETDSENEDEHYENINHEDYESAQNFQAKSSQIHENSAANYENASDCQKIPSKKSSKVNENLPKNSEMNQNLDQIIKIKEEDEFEFRIIELNPLSDHIPNDSQLDSTIEFEEEQKTFFRLEGDGGYLDQGSMDSNVHQMTPNNQDPMNLGLSSVKKMSPTILNQKIRQIDKKSLNSDFNQLDLQNSIYLTIKEENNDQNSSINTSITTSINQIYIKQEDEENFTNFFTENFLEEQILQESSKLLGHQLKFTEVCSQKLAKLSKILEKPSQNEKTLSRISFKNSSNSIPKQSTNRVQIISKLIKLDKEDLTELPKDIMDTYNIKKYSVSFEKREGQVINMYNIPYYVCTSCSTVFVTQNIFFMHYKILHATTENPFNCWKCATSYDTWKDLINHLKCHDENRQFTCKYCFFPFKLKESLVKHVEKVHVDKIEKITCEICGRSFDTERDILIHKNRHEGREKIIKIGEVKSSHAVQRINSIKCIFCPAQFFRNEDLEEHYKTHKALEKMKCRSCGKDVMVNPQYIIKNIKMREFRCIKCVTPIVIDKSNTDFSKSISIVDRQIKIEKSPDTKAAVETSSSKNEETAEIQEEKVLKNVTTMNTDRETKKLAVKCYVCGEDVGSNIKLFWHMKGHLELNQFNCPVCREDFASREAMIEHCKTEHSTEKTTKCEICKKEFHFVDLKTHMKTHEVPIQTYIPVEPFHTPKRIKLNSVGVASSLKPSIQVQIPPKIFTKPILIHKPALTATKSTANNGTVFFGSRCPVCNEYVQNRYMAVHSQKHEEEKTSKLIRNIQNRRRREDFLNKLKKPSSKLIGERKNC